MKLSPRKIRDYYELTFECDNTRVESGLLEQEEYDKLAIENIEELLYYSSDKVFKFICENYSSDIYDSGYVIEKDL